MKKIYAILFFLVVLNVNSQTITQSFNEPIVGDIDRSNRLDTSGYTTGLPINVTGANCSWNFTKLGGIFPMVIDSFILPSAAPGSSAFPNATYAQNRDKAYTFYRSRTSPSQTELLGGYSPSLSLTFTNTAIIAGYPVNYGYYLNDAVSGSFKYNTTNGACNGNIIISADGIGTVNLPNGVTIPNVIRLKSVEILTLSTTLLPLGTFNQTIYNYYMPGKKFPIVNISYSTYNLLTGTPTITALVYGDESYFNIIGVDEQKMNKSNFTAFPNPFHDKLQVGTGNEGNEFLFYNIDGQMILTTKNLAQSDLEKLKPGIYFLETKSSIGIYRQKIIKE